MATITRDITVDWGVTGLAASLTYNVVDPLDADLVAASSSGIVEFPAGSGIYHKRITTWDSTWVGRVIWRNGSSGVGNFAVEAFDANGVVNDFATDAIDADAIAGSAVTEIAGGVTSSVATASEIANALAGIGVAQVIGIVQGRAITIYKGDDYSTDPTARRWRFLKQTGEPWPDDLAGHTITFYAAKTDTNGNTGDASITLTGTIVTATGDTQEVKFEPLGTDLDSLALGIGRNGYEWWVYATEDSKRKTLRSGFMNVLEGAA